MHGMDTNEELAYWRERAKRAEAKLVAMTAARDEACVIAEAYCTIDGHKDQRRIAELRKVGSND